MVLGAGTGGTFTGVARYFKERDPRVRAVLVEPQGSIWGGGPAGPHKVEGIGNSFWPGALDRSLVDEIVTVNDETSFAAVKELARQRGPARRGLVGHGGPRGAGGGAPPPSRRRRRDALPRRLRALPRERDLREPLR